MTRLICTRRLNPGSDTTLVLLAPLTPSCDAMDGEICQGNEDWGTVWRPLEELRLQFRLQVLAMFSDSRPTSQCLFATNVDSHTALDNSFEVTS